MVANERVYVKGRERVGEPLFREPVALVDLETTGVVPGVDRILEIAILRFLAEGEEDFHRHVYDGQKISPDSTAVHGLTLRYLARHGQPPDVVLDAASEFLRPCTYLVSHGLKFDVDFLVAAGVRVPPKQLCTLRLARHLLPEVDSFKLSALYAPLTTSNARLQPHHAIEDVAMLETVFAHLASLAENQRPENPLGLLLELQEKVPINYKIPVGKHKGVLIRDLPLGYVEWAVRNGAFDGDLNEAMTAVLAIRRGP